MSRELLSVNTSFLGSPQSQNKVIHLPRDSEGRKALKDRIDIYLTELKQSESNRQKILFLQTRKKLIDNYGLSIKRIDHLQKIFLYYCTHIFKTGKHMTFERLQYDKSHLSIQRFFMFLKDFGLTSAIVQGQPTEIINKNQVILMLKKVSLNCKDLNFQQFIACLQKIAILYLDCKNNYGSWKLQLQKGRQERKQQYLKSVQRRREWQRRSANRTEVLKQFISRVELGIDSPNLKEKRQNIEKQQVRQEIKQEKTNQNDDLINQMMNNIDIVDPLQEIKNTVPNLLQELKQQININVQESQVYVQDNNISQQEVSINAVPNHAKLQERKYQNLSFKHIKSHHLQLQTYQDLLILTPQEKIQYFYQLIGVDNSVSFKKKMRQLNLPIFQLNPTVQGKHRRVVSHLIRKPQPTQVAQQSKQLKSEYEFEQQRRLTELRAVIEQKKERDRVNSPQLSKQLYDPAKNKSNQKQMKHHRQNQLSKKGIELKDLQTDLSSLSQMPMEDIKFVKNPTSSYQIGRQADPYLQDYFSVKRADKSQKIISSATEQMDKNTNDLLDKIKKRVRQMEIREKNNQAKYAYVSDVSPDHQIHKNRLVQKIIRIHQK